jgi:hypothetical protein
MNLKNDHQTTNTCLLYRQMNYNDQIRGLGIRNLPFPHFSQSRNFLSV